MPHKAPMQLRGTLMHEKRQLSITSVMVSDRIDRVGFNRDFNMCILL
jgi:hypothetical protein